MIYVQHVTICTLCAWYMMLWGYTLHVGAILAIVLILLVLLTTERPVKVRIWADAMGQVCILT